MNHIEEEAKLMPGGGERCGRGKGLQMPCCLLPGMYAGPPGSEWAGEEESERAHVRPRSEKEQR